MTQQKLQVLLIFEECNPEWTSVPLMAYNLFKNIHQLVNVTLVTHIRNQEALERQGFKNIIYIAESQFMTQCYQWAARLSGNSWQLLHMLSYPIYAEFNHRAYIQVKDQIQTGVFDLVHVMTPMMPRYPVKTLEACQNVPFLLGPVNGGLPFPEGFREVAKKEYAYLNFLRTIGRWLVPGYVTTYKQADKILSGSTYTLELLKKMFSLSAENIELFPENGIDQSFLRPVSRKSRKKVNLLFVGRLVPYKGADMLIEAIAQLTPTLQNQIHLTLVGDGQERQNLEAQVQSLHLGSHIEFAGWIDQTETAHYYHRSDLFCFPSVREFGGAVVLEAMACGLPCIVVNNGGIGEYVTEKTGFKIEPRSRDYVIQELALKITELVEQPEKRQSMSIHAIERGREFEWGRKAQRMVEIYRSMIAQKQPLSQNISQKEAISLSLT
jgi:glycosyltransferase involved in cell wall biosynthesis